MGIHGSVLYHNMFRDTDTERGKVPQRFDTSDNNLLQSPLVPLSTGTVITPIVAPNSFLFGREVIQMENRNTIHNRTCQFLADNQSRQQSTSPY